MAIKKNAATAAPAPAEKPKATKAKPAVAEASAEDKTPQANRKDLAVAIRAALQAEGKAVPLGIVESMTSAYEKAVISNLAAGRQVNLPGFGKFALQHKPAGTARNPTNGEIVPTAAKTVCRFKVGSKLKEMVSGAVLS